MSGFSLEDKEATKHGTLRLFYFRQICSTKPWSL